MGKINNKIIVSERKKRIFSRRTLILTFLSVAIVSFLVTKIDLRKTIATFVQANIGLVACSFLMYFLSNFFKTLRFRALLSDYNISLLNLYRIVSYHNFFNQILPARTGELTLVYYLNKHANINSTRGLHSLLLARIFDLIIVSVFFVISLLLFYGRSSSPLLLVLGIIVAVVSVVLLFNINNLFKFVLFIFTILFKALHLRDTKIAKAITGKLQMVVEELREFDTKRYIPLLIVTSIFVWIALHVFSFLTIHAFNFDIELLKSVIGSTGAILTNVLPVNSFGSFGTMEAGWTGGFMFVGMSKQDAITTAFGYHIINFFASMTAALMCAGLFKLKGIKGPGKN